MYQFLQALNDYYQLIFRLHTIFAANSYFVHKEGVELVYLCSNQVCDNLRIARNTSPHPFCVLMSLATLSFRGRSLVR